jgi:hypothetical protein
MGLAVLPTAFTLTYPHNEQNIYTTFPVAFPDDEINFVSRRFANGVQFCMPALLDSERILDSAGVPLVQDPRRRGR